MTNIKEFARQVAEDFCERQKGTPERFNLELSDKAVIALVEAAFYASMIPGELFAKFQTGFYADPVDAVFKALGVQ